MKTIILFILISLTLTAKESLSDIREVLKIVETEGNINAIGDNGRAYGILQIHHIVIKDVNNYYGTSYTHKDAFDEVCSEEIFDLYVGMGIKRYRKKYRKEPTEQDIVRFWNGGIYKGYRKSSTIVYWEKYLRKKKIICG